MQSEPASVPGAVHRVGRPLWLVTGLLALLVLAPLAFSAALHADEFNVLRHATRFAAGDWSEPSRPGLLWALLAPLTRAGPLLAPMLGRLVALCGALASVALLLGRRPRGATWAAAWVLLSCGGWWTTSFELRTDTFTTPLTLLAMGWLLPDPTETEGGAGGARRALLGGLCLGLALGISQKSLYNCVAVAGAIALLGEGQLGARLRRLAWAALAAGVVLLAWYGLLVSQQAEPRTWLATHLGGAHQTAFGSSYPLSRKLRWLWGVVLRGPLLPGAALLGVVVLAARRVMGLAWESERRPLAFGLVALAMMATIGVHRGFFGYFIGSFWPFAALPAGWLLELLWGRRRWAVVLAVLATLGFAVPRWLTVRSVGWAGQRAVIRGAVAAAPTPVPHFDGVGLLAGYPQVGGFLTFGRRNALRATADGAPDARWFADLWRREAPPLWLRLYLTRARHFSDEEESFVARHYQRVAPNVYLLGARHEGGEQEIEVLRSGLYRWHGAGATTLDGRPLAAPGTASAPLELAAGRYRLDGEPGVLLWGAEARPAADDAVDYSVFANDARERFQRYPDLAPLPGTEVTEP